MSSMTGGMFGGGGAPGYSTDYAATGGLYGTPSSGMGGSNNILSGLSKALQGMGKTPSAPMQMPQSAPMQPNLGNAYATGPLQMSPPPPTAVPQTSGLPNLLQLLSASMRPTGGGY